MALHTASSNNRITTASKPTQSIAMIIGRQKRLLICILARLIGLLGIIAIMAAGANSALGGVFLLLYFLGGIGSFIMALFLGSAVYGPIGFIPGLCTAIPFFGLICLFLMNQRATHAVKRAGYEVGLLGAKTRRAHAS